MKKSLLRTIKILVIAAIIALARYFYPKPNIPQQPEQIEETRNDVLPLPEEENGMLTDEAPIETTPLFTDDITQYLQPDNPKVVKYAQHGEYEIFSLDLTIDTPSKTIDARGQASCDGYGMSDCVNVLTKNGIIIYQHTPANPQTPWIGSFQTFTEQGVTFSYVMGEGGPCGRWMARYLTYYHLPTGKMLYGIYSERETWKNGECCEMDEECHNIERIKESSRTFFESPHIYDGTEKTPLDLQADDIEEAFYIHYQINE